MLAPSAEEADPPKGEETVTTASPRSVRAWQAWLGALATDAEAALAAAMAYRELSPDDRETWLQSLADDSQSLDVPRIAVYAPLLAVELDPDRRDRIREAIGPEQSSAAPRQPVRALIGARTDGSRVAVIIRPLYMNFVEVLACLFNPGHLIEWVRHDPIAQSHCTVSAGDELGGAQLEERPLKSVVDELARTIVAHNRTGEPVPEAMRAFAHLFDPDFGC